MPALLVSEHELPRLLPSDIKGSLKASYLEFLRSEVQDRCIYLMHTVHHTVHI